MLFEWSHFKADSAIHNAAHIFWHTMYLHTYISMPLYDFGSKSFWILMKVSYFDGYTESDL